VPAKDQNIISLSLSAAAVFAALLWLFFGEWFVSLIAAEQTETSMYFFLSGIVLSLGAIGISAFVKTILCLTEFLVEKDSLPLLMYRSVMDDDSEGVFFKDKKGRYRIINPIAQKVLGLEGKQVVGNRDQSLHDSLLSHKIEQEDKRVLELGDTIVWEVEKSTGLGREAFLCKKIPCRDRKGRIIGITGLCKNLTIIKTFQNLNVELEERYRKLFNRLPYPVLVLDVATMLPMTFNSSMTKMLGCTTEEFANTRFTVHTVGNDAELLRNILADMKHKGGGEFEIKLTTREKDQLEVSGYAQEILIDDRKYLHIILQDITDSKESTRHLISSELKYRSLFEHANDAILIVDIPTLQVVDANDVALSFLDYSRDDLNLLSVYDLDVSSAHGTTQARLNDLEIYNHVLYEHEICDRKNHCYQVEINAHKVNYGSEEVYQFVIRNISERKKTEQALIASEQRYRQMFDSNRAVKLVINPATGIIEDANQAAAEFYGYSKQQMKGMPISQINVLSDEKLAALITTAAEHNLGYYTCPHKLANGDIRFVEVRDGPMDINGQELLYSIVHDVTASKQAEDQLVLASKMFDCSNDAALITDENNKVVSVNQAFTQITGYQQAEILGLEPGMILAGRNEVLFTDMLLEEINSKGHWQGDLWHRTKAGETRPLTSTINVVKDEHGKITNHVIFMAPGASQVNEESSHKANYTGLTGLPNRSLFMDRLKYAIDRSQRSDKQLALLLVDFRNFGEINDKYGYDIGDSVLRAVAKRLKYNVRESDCVAHFCSDDFAVFLEDLSDVQQAGVVAQKIISTLAEGYQVEDREIRLEVSIGISITPTDGVTVDSIIERAGLALKQAQQESGNHFKFRSRQLDVDAHVWLQTEQKLHRALRNNELFVSYLPQYNTLDGIKVEAVEALVRWRYDDSTILLPESFLPTAEQSGFIGAIGFRVISMALSELNGWMAQGLAVKHLHLNVCHTQIDEDLLVFLVDKCEKYQVPFDMIVLDFTESKFVNVTNEHRKILENLQALGFSICIDDFGSGAASLSCMLQCSVNAIKIDPALVARSHSSPGALNLLKGILALTEKLDIVVIAEGIESEAQFTQLQQLGCCHMQGLYFGEPLMSQDVPQLFKEQ
jgi:diguanylate cyclase (GGDEF)-like protein/PAS domain S-box-containing protein